MNKFRVFIVDDDRDFAESLAMLIERQDCEVELAFSRKEAIKKFREQDFDITFLDVKLSGQDGVENFLEIHMLKPSAKVVMMTGYNMEQLLAQAIEHGTWGILTKPFDAHRALKTLEKIKPDGILIMDNDPDFVEAFKNLLENNGYTVLIAQNGQKAIERIRSNGIDILILDLRLPILNGLETYLELKRIGHAIPTLIATAYADEDANNTDKLWSLPASGILRKPFDPRELLETVERLSHTR
ncbi:response regulator [Chloroflexota bacterium]